MAGRGRGKEKVPAGNFLRYLKVPTSLRTNSTVDCRVQYYTKAVRAGGKVARFYF